MGCDRVCAEPDQNVGQRAIEASTYARTRMDVTKRKQEERNGADKGQKIRH